MAAAWAINLAVAERAIRKRTSRNRRNPTRTRLGRVAMNRRPGSRALALYEIRFVGHLAEHWSTWFDGLAVAHEEDGTTTLRGAVTDQAELHGLLAEVRNLNATLISVIPANADHRDGP